MLRKIILFAAFLSLIISFTPSLSVADPFHLITCVSGDSIGDQFYHIANGHGDVNGDGYEDVLIGAPAQDNSGGGYAKLFFGGTTFDTIPDLIFGMDSSDSFGFSCAFVGDVNADSYDDIMIGDPYVTYRYYGDGAAYLYYGGANMDTIPNMIFRGEFYWHTLGENVSGAGDVNGDGYDDWLINAPNDDICALGRIYLYYGGAQVDTVCDVYFQGEPFDGLRFQHPALGDINGDGCGDLIFNNIAMTKVDIHFGSPVMDAVPDLMWRGDSPQRFFSIPVAGVGDLNADGFNDWIICINQDYSIFFGSANPDTIPDMVFSPELPCTWFWDMVVGSDIDGNGVDDIVFGGGGADSSWTGNVSGYLGGPNFDNQYDFFFDSGIYHEFLGITLGVADIDGDSVFEVIGGAMQENVSNQPWGPGRVWILTTQEMGVPRKPPPAPCAFTLLPPYPNPFNAALAIPFTLREALPLKITVFDAEGRQTAVLLNHPLSAGNHIVRWDASNLSSGVYLIRLQTPQAMKTAPAALVK